MIKDFHKTAIIAGNRYVSYKEMLRRITYFARYTSSHAGAKTVILSENREGWIYAFFSIWLNRGIAVPVDATATPDEVAYTLRDSEAECIWTSNKKLDTAREAMHLLGRELPILIIDEHEQVELSDDIRPAKIDYESSATAVIIYTSGTTGSPKGVMLSFGNMMANVDSVSKEVRIYTQDRRAIILLPLHHVLPLLGCLVAPITVGGGVAIAPAMTGPDILDTLKRGKVGLMIGVPRLWTTLIRGIKAKVEAKALTRAIFKMCRALQWRWLSRLVFTSVRQALGGHLDILVSGGAALDREIAIDIKTLGLDLLEGYGMSECAPMISFTRPDDIVPGSVGKPLPSEKVILKNGEICVKGPNVMQGYYNRPEETAAIFDDEGWLHTGDLGRFDDKGRLYITGRTKEIVVLSNGKNINPSEIEFKLEQHTDIVKEVGIIQDVDMLKAIIVPQAAWIQGRNDEELEEALKRELLEPYNQEVPPYKRLMSLFVYHGELPRTKMDKLQRFKLPALVSSGEHTDKNKKRIIEPSFPEYKIIKNYIQHEKKCPVSPTDNLDTDLQLDSLDKVGLQGFLEQTFGMDISAERIAAFRNVLELAEHVADYKTRIEVEKIDWHHILHEDTQNLKLPDAWPDDLLILWFFKLIARLYFRLEGRGAENIPQEGPYMLAANHQSFLDGMLVMAYSPKKNVRKTFFFAKESHVKHPIVQSIAKRHNVIVMEPTNLKTSIQRMGEAFKQGKNIIIFPEGTRTETGEVGEFKKTFAILAKELNVPIVPCSIHGAYEALPKHSKWARPFKIRVDYLPVIQPQPDDTYDTLTRRVRDAIIQNQRGL